jgi:hypothetical protein
MIGVRFARQETPHRVIDSKLTTRWRMLDKRHYPVLPPLWRQPGRRFQRPDDKALHRTVPRIRHPRRGGVVLFNKQRALGVGSAVLIEGPGEYVIDGVKGQRTSTSVVRGAAAAIVSKSLYEPLIERGAKGLSSNEATLWNTSFSTLFEVKKGMVGGTIEAFHNHYMQ